MECVSRALLCGLKSYKEAQQQVSASKVPFIEPLQTSNYSERFSLLVDLEELQEQSQIRNYDRKDETLTEQGSSKFLLQVRMRKMNTWMYKNMGIV